MNKILSVLESLESINKKENIKRNKNNMMQAARSLSGILEFVKFFNNLDRSLGVIAKIAESNKS